MNSVSEVQPSGTRQRLDHVDAMRPIKQTAVISTHALIYFAPLSTSLVASGMLTLTHFSRDAFLFVSACMLAYSYRDSNKIDFARYWKRRFMAVGLVYLVWSVIYFPVAGLKDSTSFPYYRLPMSAIFSMSGLHNFLFAIATGYYHLYFLLVLLEFYVLFPWIFMFLRRHANLRIPILIASLAWQVVFPMVIRRGWLGFVVTSKVETRLVFSYPLYLIGGVIAAFYLERFHDWVVRHQKALLIATVLLGAVPLVLDYFAKHGVHMPLLLVPGGNPFAAAVIPYDVGAIILVYLFGVYLVSPKRSARTRAVVASGSEAAYGIYVSQVLWILWFQRWGQQFNLLHSVPWIVTTLCAVVFTYLIGWLFSALVARTPLARAVVGRGQLPWHTLFWWRHHVDPEQHRDFGEGPLNLTNG
ncbi:MAG TPA: acyltransferase [Acidimicrobiales bacterium]|jgi:peptidoglycan/LPS O-acetylase OafA/YrhL